MPGGFDAFILGTDASEPAKAPPRTQAPVVKPQHKFGSFMIVSKGRGACTRCRRLKLRCCENRPCKFCVMKNCGGSCTDWVPQTSQTEMEVARSVDFTPVQERTTRFHYARPCSREEMVSELMKAGCGFSKNAMNSMVEGFTDDLYVAMYENLTMLRGLAKKYPAMVEYMTGSKTAPTAEQLAGNLPQVDEKIEFKREEGEYSFFIQVLDDEFSSLAVMMDHLDLKSGACVGISFNRRFADLMGCSSEELMSRIGTHDLAIQNFSTELDLVSMTVDHLASFIQGKNSCFYRVMTKRCMSRQGQILNEGNLLKFEQNTEMENGVAKNVTFLTPVDVQEWDQARITCPEQVRGLQRMIGDDRSGQQLLADHANDKKNTFKRLQKTDLGRLKLNAFAAAIRKKLSPIVENIMEQAKILQQMHDAKVAATMQAGGQNSDAFAGAYRPMPPTGTEDRFEEFQQDDSEVDYAAATPDSIDSFVQTPESMDSFADTPCEMTERPVDIVETPSDTVATPSDELFCNFSAEATPDPGCEGLGDMEESVLFREEAPPEHDNWTESFSFVDDFKHQDSNLSQASTEKLTRDHSYLIREHSALAWWAEGSSSVLEEETVWSQTISAS